MVRATRDLKCSEVSGCETLAQALPQVMDGFGCLFSPTGQPWKRSLSEEKKGRKQSALLRVGFCAFFCVSYCVSAGVGHRGHTSGGEMAPSTWIGQGGCRGWGWSFGLPGGIIRGKNCFGSGGIIRGKSMPGIFTHFFSK